MTGGGQRSARAIEGRPGGQAAGRWGSRTAVGWPSGGQSGSGRTAGWSRSWAIRWQFGGN